jgi:hypothetical protein
MTFEKWVRDDGLAVFRVTDGPWCGGTRMDCGVMICGHGLSSTDGSFEEYMRDIRRHEQVCDRCSVQREPR